MDNTNPKLKANKMATPEKSVRAFNFPAHNVTFNAENRRDAEKKLHNYLNKND